MFTFRGRGWRACGHGLQHRERGRSGQGRYCYHLPEHYLAGWGDAREGNVRWRPRGPCADGRAYSPCAGGCDGKAQRGDELEKLSRALIDNSCQFLGTGLGPVRVGVAKMRRPAGDLLGGPWGKLAALIDGQRRENAHDQAQEAHTAPPGTADLRPGRVKPGARCFGSKSASGRRSASRSRIPARPSGVTS